MQLNQTQLSQVNAQIKRLINTESYYGKIYQELGIDGISSQEDFEKLPFSSKDDLRNAYPLGIQAVPDEEVVRIHSSSGTTGKPVIIPYTTKDVDDWAAMFARCYETAGITNKDRIQITPGYGLWTAGIGFQAGCEKLGAMAIPMGPGNTDKQLQMMMDLKSTVITATSSYALLLAEEINKRGLKDKIHLKKGVIGSERWSEKMRAYIRENLGIELYDIYGLTEVYGPGIGINCEKETGIHYWDDYIYIEIIDSKTGQPVPDGEEGEIVITTLVKEGAPLIRFRTHDISRIIPEKCSCGRCYPRIDIIKGRSDDMFKVHGVNMFPSQVEDLLQNVDGVSSEYSITIAHDDEKNRDIMIVTVEAEGRVNFEATAQRIKELFKSRIGVTPKITVVPVETLPRSEKKTKRVTDYREEQQ
ncbi:MAG: phenylacetate--CoA ligase [Lachnospiraceae bacterium]|nr:phenylacetate--CoA ligase [Lachnospiraceae bacterium]